MATQRVLVAKSARRKAAPPKAARKPGDAYDYPVITVGRTPGGVGVFVASSLGKAGLAVAQDCMSRIDRDVSALADLFGIPAPRGLSLIVAPLSSDQSGDGGAYHYGCEGTDLYCDCCTATPKLTSALFVAEAVEVFSQAQGKGWNCGDTNGEGLSRVLAEVAYPGVLDGYETASAWLDSDRPNWIDRQQGTDTDDRSNGCAVLFLYWLTSGLGLPMARVVQAIGNTLAECYQRLTGRSDGWTRFSDAARDRWPMGAPSGVMVDNPWTGATPPPPPPPPTPPPTPTPEALGTVMLSTDAGTTADGVYMLLPVPSDMQRRLRRAGLTAAQWGALVQTVINAILTALPIILGADANKGEPG